MKLQGLPFLSLLAAGVSALGFCAPAHAAGHVTEPSEAAFDAALSGGGKVIFDCDATITVSNTKTIAADTEIDGNGHAVTLSGGGTRRIFLVEAGWRFSISGLSLINGRAEGPRGAPGNPGHSPHIPTALATPGGDGSWGAGGAIRTLSGSFLSAKNCIFSGNRAVGGIGGNGGPDGWADSNYPVGQSGGQGGIAAGGAICAESNASNQPTLELIGCTFTDNQAIAGRGGHGGEVAEVGFDVAGWTPAYIESRYQLPPDHPMDVPADDNFGDGRNGGQGGSGGQGASVTGGAVASITGSYAGAGYFSTNMQGAVTIRNCTFNNNRAIAGAGGQGAFGGYSRNGGPDNVVGGAGGDGGSGGQAGAASGGAITAYSIQAYQSTFVSNSAQGGDGGSGKYGTWGGRAYNTYGTTGYASSAGRGGSGGYGANGGDAEGGALYSYAGSSTSNCTFATNNAGAGAGGNGGYGGDGGPAQVGVYGGEGGQGGAAGNGGDARGGGLYYSFLTFGTFSGNGALRGGAGTAGAGGHGYPAPDINWPGSRDGGGGSAGVAGSGWGGAAFNGMASNSIFSNSTSGGDVLPVYAINQYNGFQDAGGNICGDGTLDLAKQDTNGDGTPDKFTSRVNTNPLLGSLTDNGGPTATFALLAGSPAINAASYSYAISQGLQDVFADQRGYGRLGVPDSGAFEANGRVRAQANPLVVTLGADRLDENDNQTSLREAIEYANSHEGPDTIKFALETDDAGYDAAKKVFAVTVGAQYSYMPSITDNGTVIDGSSQTAFGGDTNPYGPEIKIATQGITPFNIQANDCTIQNLWFLDNTGAMTINLDGSRNTVRACYFSTDEKGQFDPNFPNNGSISITNHGNGDGTVSVSDGNVIGGTAVADGNRLSSSGLTTYYASNTLIGHNTFMGDMSGVNIQSSDHTQVKNNVLRGQSPLTLGDTNDSVIQNNTIEGYFGVIVGGQRNSIRFNRIVPQERSYLALAMRYYLTEPIANDDQDADEGNNGLQNHPDLETVTVGTTTSVTGGLNSKPNSTYLLDFYAGAAADEWYRNRPLAERFLGTKEVTTDAQGHVDFTFTTTNPVALSDWVTATATDASGNTSQLAPAALAPAPTITSFSPALGKTGATVTINGTSLFNTNAVNFNGTNATVFTVVSNTRITARVPSGATTGPITLSTPSASVTSAANFIVDDIVPAAIMVAAPAPNTGVNTFAQITGTATDNDGGSGIAKVELALKRVSDGQYWSGTAWGGTSTNLTASVSGTNWKLNSGLPVTSGTDTTRLLTEGAYTLTVTATDKAGNKKSINSNFTFDKSLPIGVTLTTPTPNAGVNTFTVINGTASDNAGGSGIGKVELGLKRGSDGAYWDGMQWTSTASVVLASVSGTNWKLNNNLPVASGSDTTRLLTEGAYTLAVTAYDKAGNKKSITANFSFDKSLPVGVTVTTPAPATGVNTLLQIVGTASDNIGGSGVGHVDLTLKRNGDGLYWNGSNWDGTAAVVLTTSVSGTNWKRNSGLPLVSGTDATKLLTEGAYSLTVTAYDKAGNKKSINSSFSYDRTVPSSVTVTTPAPSSAVNSFTQILGTAADNTGGSGINRLELLFKRNSDGQFWNGSSWSAGSAALLPSLSGSNWKLNSGLPVTSGTDTTRLLTEGLYTLSATAYDKAGNVRTVNSTFTFDKTVPATLTVSTPLPSSTVTSLPLVNGTAADNTGGSGLTTVEVNLKRNSDGVYWDGTSWNGPTAVALAASMTGGTWKVTAALPSATTADAAKKLTAGTYTLTVTVTDKAGNKRVINSIFTVSAPASAFVVTDVPQVAVGAEPESASVGRAKSPYFLSLSTARASLGTITLAFTGSVDIDSASQTVSYSIVVNETEVPAQSVRIASNGATVTLGVEEDVLRAGDRVGVRFNLLDSRKRSLQGIQLITIR